MHFRLHFISIQKQRGQCGPQFGAQVSEQIGRHDLSFIAVDHELSIAYLSSSSFDFTGFNQGGEVMRVFGEKKLRNMK